MIKRTIEISQNPAHLAVRLGQLLIQPHDQPDTILSPHASIPCEDIGLVLVDHPRTTYSHAALVTIVEKGGVLIVCDGSHLPSGMLLPLADHSQVLWRLRDQMAALEKKPLCKQLWQTIVQRKIEAQARNLMPASAAERRLRLMVRSVRSGDPDNLEAQAAKVYWSNWSPPLDGKATFRRDTEGIDPLNAMLNYGYAVLRAGVARALVAGGLLPMLGIHHSSRGNNFALADDLVEPLRPLVDARARELYLSGHREISKTVKAGLLSILTDSAELEDETGPLMVHLHRMAAGLVQCFDGSRSPGDLPVPTAILASKKKGGR